MGDGLEGVAGQVEKHQKEQRTWGADATPALGSFLFSLKIVTKRFSSLYKSTKKGILFEPGLLSAWQPWC